MNAAGFIANYDQVENFQAVTFSDRSLANVSGIPKPLLPPPIPSQVFTTQQGSLQVVGDDISLTETSLLLGQTGAAATQTGGNLHVNAAGTLLITDSEATSFLRSGIFSETIGPSDSGAIKVQAEQLDIEGGASIIGLTFSGAKAGDISIQINDQIDLNGFNALNPLISSTISTASASSGRSGNIEVDAAKIQLSDSGNLNSLAFADGQSGNIEVDAADINITGRVAASNIPSGIAASNFGTGTAGDINITTERLSIAERAVIAASSISDGSAGNIHITATERIDISSAETEATSSRAINSAVLFPTAQERAIFMLGTSPPQGNAGSINITTAALTMSGLVEISVENQGLGGAGDIQLSSNRVELKNGSQISALTNAGDGGNLNLQITDALLLRNGSGLTVKSGGTGDGGNINLNSGVVIALENSDIIANAEQGRGGNIDIVSQNILGTAFRDRLTAESDISASSEFGINGTVDLDTPTVDPASGIVALPSTVVDANQQITASCADQNQSNQFIASGRGGLPPAPQNSLAPERLWQDVRPTSSIAASPITTNPHTTNSQAAAIPGSAGSDLIQSLTSNAEDIATLAEAMSWTRHPNGDVQLMASNALPSAVVHCLATAG
ncbi:MAG: hypothetical protein AB8B99_17110 [Phormidesmis sp.]